MRSVTLLNPGLDLAVPQLQFPASLLATPSNVAQLAYPILTSSLPVLSHLNQFLWKSVLSDKFGHSDSLAFSFLARYNGGKASALRIAEGRDELKELMSKDAEIKRTAARVVKKLQSGSEDQQPIVFQLIFTEVRFLLAGGSSACSSRLIHSSLMHRTTRSIRMLPSRDSIFSILS